MDYHHSRKAGNEGDVWKHATLLTLADWIAARADTFQYVESHSGSPVHKLADRGEWKRGVGRLVENGSCNCLYTSIAKSWVERKQYPAGWVFVVNRLAGRFARISSVLADVADSVAAAYPPSAEFPVPRSVKVEFQQADGFSVVTGLERADLVFLDPPFHPDAEGDWRKLAGTCLWLAEREVPFVAWYPFYWPTRPQWLVDTTGCEAWEVAWAHCGSKPSQNLKGCGMLASTQVVPSLRHGEQELKRVSACLGAEFRVRYPAAV